MIDDIENKIENLWLLECSLKKQVLLEVSYFARNIYVMKTVNSGLYCIEDLIFLKNNIVWFWNYLDVESTDSSVKLYSILPYLRLFYQQLSAPVFGKECIILKKL